MSLAPSGLITLTTDFGAAEPFAGIVSGRILSRFPAARIVDLSHGLPAGRPDHAGFWLRQAWREFPSGTLHLAIVDPGVGTARRVMLALAAGHMLLAPDNGLLPEALRDTSGVRWLAMDPALPDRLGLGALSRTFHGRDLFAPLAAELAAGRLRAAGFGASAKPLDPAPLPAPSRDAEGVLGRVLLADRFGNLFSNIDGAQVAACRQPTVEAAGRLWPVLPTYGAAPAGTLLSLVNAFGLLELAINGGNASVALALREGAPVRLRDGLAT
jgi:S-adenosyl-L-methionine hydrolase (adenosine-forming)